MTQATRTQRRIHKAAVRLFDERGAAPVSVSELSKAAGVSEDIIHGYVDDISALFSEVLAQMAGELHAHMEAGFGSVADPAARVAMGMRWYVKMAHDDPAWARFVCHFAFSAPVFSTVWSGPAVRDIFEAVEGRRYDVHESDILRAVVFISSSVLGAMHLVCAGLADWRDAGTSSAEWVLRGLGVSQEEAARLARMTLPELPPLTEL